MGVLLFLLSELLTNVLPGDDLWFQRLKYVIIESLVNDTLFFPQIIAFVLEGKKSKLTRRPKASDYQRLDQKVSKETQVHGRALHSQPGPAVGLHLAQKQQLVLGVPLPLPLPFSDHKVETSNVHVYSVRAKRPLITSQQLPPLTEEETQAQKSFFSFKFLPQVHGKIKAWWQLPRLPSCAFRPMSALHKFS